MVLTCAERGGRGGRLVLYWTKDAKDEAARQEEIRKTSKKIHGCRAGGHTEGWCDRGRCKRSTEMESDDPLWRPPLPKGAGERRRFGREREMQSCS